MGTACYQNLIREKSKKQIGRWVYGLLAVNNTMHKKSNTVATSTLFKSQALGSINNSRHWLRQNKSP
jgi:hypothetical protein